MKTSTNHEASTVWERQKAIAMSKFGNPVRPRLKYNYRGIAAITPIGVSRGLPPMR